VHIREYAPERFGVDCAFVELGFEEKFLNEILIAIILKPSGCEKLRFAS
jgi:hypothetical protein